MSANAPSRRLLQSSLLQSLPQTSSRSNHFPLERRRTIFNFFRKNKTESQDQGPSNPVLDEFLKRKPTKGQIPGMQRGDLASSSIFEADRQIAERDAAEQEDEVEESGGPQTRNKLHMSTVLDPDPRSRERWERKMVIREIQKGGRLTRTQMIKRTERESSSKSPNFKTSIKKLGPLARQIQGKTLDEAITQMRFSKKKVAKNVLEYLEYARDEAIVSRGMGLGKVKPAEDLLETVPTTTSKPIEIQLKDGKRHVVKDASKIYVDQAWVGRGSFGRLPDYRARGRVYIMRPPFTHMSVILKEEKTRVREYNEREEKRKKQRLAKVWTPLPDRPIQSQTQWYTW